MEENDPFAAITKLCQVSDSQEQHLNHCPFALEPQTNDESLSLDAEIPVASTAITMFSPPQTPEDNHKADQNDNSFLQNDDVFTTPLEEPSRSSSQNQQQQHHQEEISVDHAREDQRVERAGIDEIKAVDGGDCEEGSREKDLGFTVEAELTERIEIKGELRGGEGNSQDKEVIHCEYMKGMVLKRGLSSSFSSNDVLGESSTKRLKLYDNSLGLVTPKPSLRTEIGKSFERLVKSLDRFKWTPRASVGAESVKCDHRLVKKVDVTTAKSKKAKCLNRNRGLGSPRSNLESETERIRENLGDPVEKLGSEGGSGSNHGLKLPRNEQVGEMVIDVNSSDRECSGESSAKRKLEFSTEVLESEFEGNDSTEVIESDFEGNDAALRFVNDGVEEREANRLCNTREEHCARKSIDDLDKFRYVGPNDAALRFVDDGVEETKANRLCSTREEHCARKSIDDLDKFRYVGPKDAALSFVNDGVEEREANRLCSTRAEHSARKSIDDLDKFRYVGPKDAALSFVNDGVEEREANRLCSTREEHSARKSIDDLDKFRYVGPNADLDKFRCVGPNAGPNICSKEFDVREKRLLPASVLGRKENAGAGEAEHDTVLPEMIGMDLHITLLDVLKLLAEEEHYDPSLENLSILEAAKIGGMTFP